MKVREIITSPVQYCAPENSLAEVALMMWNSDCGALPVVNHDGEVMDMITDRDICMAAATKNRLLMDMSVWETSSGKVYACSPEDYVQYALKLMEQHKVRRLPVVNAAGVLEGVISLNDVILSAREENPKKITDPSYGDVIKCLQGIGGHRVLVDSQRPSPQ